MTPRQEAMLVRVFIGEADRHRGRPLFKAIVEAARDAGLAGATVLHGPVGYGQARRVHSERDIDAPGNLPMVVEIVDAEDRIRAFLPRLDALVGSGLVTLEKLRALRCGRSTVGA
jgi:PII-like signaling protein